MLAKAAASTANMVRTRAAVLPRKSRERSSTWVTYSKGQWS
jgi:hypothetical protein